MEINKIDLMQALYGTYETAFQSSSSSVSDDDFWTMSNNPSEKIDISMIGKFRNVVSQLSDDKKEEMRTFHEQMLAAIQNGTFDASEMAANAPDALKSFAEENGIDLETMLEEQASMMENQPIGMGPPPPMPFGGAGDLVSQLSDDEKEEMHTFHEEMMEAVKDGTFDASEMAANAPDALKSFAEENGIDLETLLEEQVSAPPPPPPSNNTYGGYGNEMPYSSRATGAAAMKYMFKTDDDEQTTL
ncbi:MAG: hypothetical protein JW932_18565 [Deltaproteobacteria bacterium]|nr:hypothetical protein [Deltaproteobacteria bacterium]